MECTVRMPSSLVLLLKGILACPILLVRCRGWRGPFTWSFGSVSGWGVENGHFVAWMRPAGTPTFRKVYGRIDEELQVGTEDYTVNGSL